MLGALSTVIIWKVLNNIIGNDNANDDEQVEAGMSDAADVMRDLLRKGLQVGVAIRNMLNKKSQGLLFEQQNRQQQKPHFCRHCLESLVRSVNILITFSSLGGFVCSTCRAASHGGGGFPLRLQLAGQGEITRMVIDMILMLMNMMMVW